MAVNSDEKPCVSLSNSRPFCGMFKTTNFAPTFFGQMSRRFSILGEKRTCIANVFSAKIRAIIFARYNLYYVRNGKRHNETADRFSFNFIGDPGASGRAHTRSPRSWKTQTLEGGPFNLVRSLFEPALAGGDLLKR